MHTVLSTDRGSTRSLLVCSLAFFAVAGLANTSLGSIRSVGAVALGVVGVYGLARYARAVSRKRLALCSLALWLAFLFVVSVRFAGLGAAGDSVPAARAIDLAARGVMWATLLGAGGSTTFLGFREYDATTGVEAGDDASPDGDLDL